MLALTHKEKRTCVYTCSPTRKCGHLVFCIINLCFSCWWGLL